MNIDLGGIMQAVALIGVANGAPVIARKVFRNHLAWPIDAGLKLHDRQFLFGTSKTWRGLVVAVICSAAIAPMLGLSPLIGAGFGALSIGADLLASFTKRRLGYAPSSRVRLLDVFPEALLPALVFKSALSLTKWDVILIALTFFVLEASFSPLLYRWNIRNRPY